MEDLLRARAVANGGYVLRGQILDCGETDLTIRSALAEGVLRRLRTGAYAFAETYDQLDAAAKHRVLAYAVADRLGPRVALSHASACASFGLSQFDVNLGRVHVTRLDAGAGRIESGIIHHVGQVLLDGDIVERDGRLIVQPARAVWEASVTTSQRGALVVMDSALHQNLVNLQDLETVAARMSRWRGARACGRHLIAVRRRQGRITG